MPSSTARRCLATDNQVFQFASLGDAPQDKKYKGEPTRLEVGDRNVFREYVTVNRGTVSGRAVTRIGSDNMLLAYSHVGMTACLAITSCCRPGDAGGACRAGRLGHHEWLCGVHQFTKVGAHAFIGNMTAVTRDVPPYVLAVGQPAEPRSVNSEGLKRRGFSEEQIRAIRNAYRVLYRSDLRLEDAVPRLQEMAAEHECLRIFVDFIGAVDPAAWSGNLPQ